MMLRDTLAYLFLICNVNLCRMYVLYSNDNHMRNIIIMQLFTINKGNNTSLSKQIVFNSLSVIILDVHTFNNNKIDD